MPSSMSYMADGSPSSSSDASTSSGGGGHIEHTVSKLDTLAGVAIKYGVEVADVKRLNGLTTDLQMFALKRLRIPTPGRHPPSTATTDPSHSRWETSTSLHRVRSQNSLVDHKGGGDKAQRSAAMDLLRGYYGLPASRTKGEGTELATLHSFDAENADDEPFSPMFPAPDRRFLTGGDHRTTSRFDTTTSDPAAAGLLMNPVGVGEIAETKDLRPVRRRTRGDSMMLGSFSDDAGLLMNPGGGVGEIEVVAAETKDRPPVRRRARGDSMMFGSFSDDAFDVSERVNFPEKVSVATRAKDATKGPSSVAAANGWHAGAGEGPGVKAIGAALFGGKGAVEGLVSKVLQSTVPDKSSAGAAPANTTTTSVLDGITQVYRRAKAALD